MSYTHFVRKVSKSLNGRIIAYDNLPDRGGCVLYLRGTIKSITIEAAAIDSGHDNVIAVLLTTLPETELRGTELLMTLRAGAIAIEERGPSGRHSRGRRAHAG